MERNDLNTWPESPVPIGQETRWLTVLVSRQRRVQSQASTCIRTPILLLESHSLVAILTGLTCPIKCNMQGKVNYNLEQAAKSKMCRRGLALLFP